MKKIAVIGAGPAGLTAAYQLSKAEGIEVELYEAADQVGGLSKTIELWGQQVDLGPHRFFSSDARVNELWLEVVEKDYQMVDRLTRIYYKGKFFHYPLKATNALKNLGIVEAIRCGFSFFKEQVLPTKDTSHFEGWVTNRFGKRLFEIFFKTYSEKLWGISCTELDADFAAQRIKKLSLYEAIKSALFPPKENKHKTLVEQFAYPLQGTGMVYNRMKTKIEANGGVVLLSSPVERILTQNGKVYGLLLEDGSEKHYDHVISTMPLSQMVKRLPEVPPNIKNLASKLQFRNTILVYLNIAGQDLFKDNWLYVHSNNLEMGRITNFKNWVPSLYGESSNTILVLEYWCNFDDKLWETSEEELIHLAQKEIQQTGLIKNAEILAGKIVKIPRCYPVYKTGYKEILKPIETYLSTIPNLSIIGRYGAFKYNNQDHSILMGILAAENILSNKENNLWEINTDYETYQESSVITETGLVRNSV